MRSEGYQIALIFLGIVATAFLGAFLYREVFPEYKIYQEDYIALEKFRSTYTGEQPPDFKVGVKQILIEREDKGPPTIDRCTSCHVALQIPHFSPTKIAKDINGSIIRDANGNPVKVPNEDYVWGKLDQKINELEDPKINEQLEKEGNYSKVKQRAQEALALTNLKTANVSGHVYDVTKVLSMHPLMGKETRPFEFHPIDDYGCTSCHNGNGRGLTTEKAHGPVFDGEYEIEYMGPKPDFIEKDPKNDPQFARVFNDKPGHELLFQINPIFVGSLIQAKCVQCHQSVQTALQSVANTATILTTQKQRSYQAMVASLSSEKKELLSLIEIKQMLITEGLAKTLANLQAKQSDFTLTEAQQSQASSQLGYLKKTISLDKSVDQQKLVLNILNQKILEILGSQNLSDELSVAIDKEDSAQSLDKFLEEHRKSTQAKGTIFSKMDMIDLEKQIMRHVEDTESVLEKTTSDENVISAIASDVDLLTSNYHRGQQLFISQACYACHRIAGLARGGVGPELSRSGDDYPWHLKGKIVWPQGDLKTSTMPNMRLDHIELQDLITFLLGQKGSNNAVSPTAYKVAIQEWEGGRKMAWEKPIPPSKIHDLHYSMTVFATEGCAACHRLLGFQSNVGFSIEKEVKENSGFDALYAEKQWFSSLFPETIVGSEIVRAIEKHGDDIDKHIAPDVRQNSLLEEIDVNFPQAIESFYANFRYASRAKNDEYTKLANAEKDPEKKKAILEKLQQWKERVHRVLMMYIQEYGLGRLIGPRPNWAGVYRSDEWLMEHFRNPSSHVPRSIMPILPFDDSKFYALTYMLDVLGQRNRDQLRAIWGSRGFNPEMAYTIHCAQCHGEYLQGNGPVSEWIYPIPKNLRNANFLRNLTRERVIQSIEHGVKGTPMPPWSETPADKPHFDGIPILTSDEVEQLVDWIFSSLPGGAVIRGQEDVPKWNYGPKEVLDELHNEGYKLKPNNHPELGSLFPKVEDYYVSLNPSVPITGNQEGQSIEDIFKVVPSPIPDPDKNHYYIKKKFYTAENINAGKAFFEINCAVCHGKEGDGSGSRAQVMQDAKPRMLTNLDWVNTRDDLRLLRSIKYGVPGTAMTPWGDFTSSLQRMQLVIFIRSLTEEREKREEFDNAMYKSFVRSQSVIENARILEYPELEKAQNELSVVKAQEDSLYGKVKLGEASPKEAAELYQKELDLLVTVEELQNKDNLLTNIKSLIAKEGEIYKNIGAMLLGKEPSDQSWKNFVEMVSLNEGRFSFTDGKLSLNKDSDNQKRIVQLKKVLESDIDAKVKLLEKEKIIVSGRIISTERAHELELLTTQINSYNKLKNAIASGLEQVAKIQNNEEKLFESYQKTLQKKKR